MDEEITIIDSNTRNEKIKNFFINNKKILFIVVSIIIISVFGYFTSNEIKERKKIKLANQYNLVTITFENSDKQKTINRLIDIINKGDATYSPMALYYLLDNNLIEDNDQINSLFDLLISETRLKKEIKNLIIYKKALFNSNFISENDLIKMLNPIINSESIWKSHALYLLAEYFFSQNEMQKSKDVFNQIILLSDSNNNIKVESQKRINRDFSE